MKRHVARSVTQIALAAALLSCGLASPGQPPVRDDADTTELGSEGTASASAGAIDGDTRVMLERTECFGSCPVYTLSIAGDGTVAFFGEKYVKVKGPASKQISVGDVQALVDQMLEADYFNLSVPDDCAAGLFSDAPSARSSLTLHGRTHTVDHYYGNTCAPAALRSIEDAIDIRADSATWIECDTSSGACCEPTESVLPCN